MAHPYGFLRAGGAWLLLLLPGFMHTAQAQQRVMTNALAPNKTDCYCQCSPNGPLTGSIGGADVLTGNNVYYLTQTSNLTGPVSWTASPASLFTITSATNSTSFVTGPAGCVSGPAVITATVRVAGCRDSVVLQKAITVSGGGTPAVQGTYYCTTCNDRSVKPLVLDGRTYNLSYYGTYRIDLTSNSSQDTFLAWDTFEAAGASLRMVSGTSNHSGIVDILPGASVAALAANVTNGCHSVRQLFRMAALNATYARTTASPNPVSEELRIDGAPVEASAVSAVAQAQAQPAPESCSAVLYNSQGSEVLRGTGPVGRLKLDVHTLPAGFYTLRTTTAAGTRSERVQVSR